MSGTAVPPTDALRARLASLSSAERAALLRRLRGDGVAPRDRTRHAPLSYTQELLWLLHQSSPDLVAYNVPRVFRVDGPVDPVALGAALTTLVQRHEILRTVFRAQGDAAVQVVREVAEVPLGMADLRDEPPATRPARAEALLREEARRPFELEHDLLLRALFVRTSDVDAMLLIVTHHVATDGWSRNIMLEELREAYAAHVERRPVRLPPLSLQYADFATWQRSPEREAALAQDLAWWRERLGGPLPVLDLPTDRPREGALTFEGARLAERLPDDLVAALRALAQSQGTTLFVVLLAALQTLLARYSGQDDILVGTPTAGRTRAETESLLGYFANTLILRGDLSGDPSFAELLERTRRVSLDALDHQDVPYERLVLDLRASGELGAAAPFQVLFTLEEDVPVHVPLSGASLTPMRFDPGWAKFDLNVSAGPREDGYWVTLEYRTALFDAETIRRLHDHFRRLLAHAAAAPATPLGRLRLLGEDERRQLLVDWNRTEAPYPRERCAHELIELQAAATPGAPAVTCGGTTLSYAELEARANAVARYLMRLGVGPGQLVAVHLERSPELLPALLGVLKSGAAYVPVDPSYPAERVRHMLNDARVPVVLTQRAIVGRLPATAACLICVDEPGTIGWTADGAALPRPAGLGPESLAYVIYTSGSTGRPKGAMITHRGLVNYLTWAATTYDAAHGSGAPVHSSLSFDLTVTGLLAPLAAGGRVHLLPEEEPVAALVAALRTRPDFTLVKITPAHLELLRQELPAETLAGQTRCYVIGGENLLAETIAHWQAHAPDTLLVNEYGPTETVVGCCVFTLKGGQRLIGSVPIGRPIANTRLYVLDRHGDPQPIGVPGELFIGGDGVGAGYLNRPELTAERFLADPFAPEPGARMYRTGDLARWRADGQLDFLGRLDDQVKLRGFRIELGEIEACAAACPGVAEFAVTVRGAGSDRRLVGYLVPAESPADVATLRAHLRARLPEYMVPAALAVVPAIPLTPNGKRDIRALAAYDAAAESDAAARPFVAPRTPEEALVAAVWSEVLGRGPVSVEDDFFELGGHSLLAMRVASRIAATAGVRVALADFFATPTVAGLARYLAERSGTPRELAPVIAPRGTADAPLSFAQELMWLIDRAQPGLTAYHVADALRLRGPVDAAALARSLTALVARHEVLRSTIQLGPDGPRQVPETPRPMPLPEHDLGGVAAERREAAARELVGTLIRAPFDLAAGPLFRAALVRLAPDDAILVLAAHHAVTDGGSRAVLLRELGELYRADCEGRAPALAPLPIQYGDFAAWQRAALAGERLTALLADWRTRLAGAPEVLELPTPKPRPGVPSFAGASHGDELPPPLVARLRALGREHGATLYMTLLAAFQALLHRYSGQADVLVGSPIAGRVPATEPLVGYFANLLVMRADFADDPAFTTALARTRASALAAFERQEVPFERLALEVRRDGAPGAAPLVQVLFALQNAERPVLELPDVMAEPLTWDLGTTKFDLTLNAVEQGDRLGLWFNYRTDLFDSPTIARLARHFRTLLTSVVEAPGTSVSALALLPAEEEAALLSLGRGAPAPPDEPSTLDGLVARQAALTPDRVAVSCESASLTYAELEERAARLAAVLRARGVGRDVRVGLCAERSVELMVGLLGVLKAGGCYVPLDPEYPRDRLAFMVGDAQIRLLLTQRKLAGTVPADGLDVLFLDEALPEAAPVVSAYDQDALAYVIYTSGSTGTPKGVMIPHHAAVNYIRWMCEAFPLDAGDALLQKAPISFDASVLELYHAIGCGARLVLARPGGHADPDYLLRTIAAERITVLQFVPSLLAALVEAPGFAPACATLRILICGGEALPLELGARVRALLPHVAIHNLYGPTETTVYSTAWTWPASGAPEAVGPAAPVGRPIRNTQVCVLDRARRLVPLGHPGEICIGGAGVARGYLHREELTADRFVPDPFSADPTARLYRTGDLGRFTPDGTLHYLGRMDQQVKVRGFRVELGEIESALIEYPGVKHAAATVVSLAPGDDRLVAYVVLDPTLPAPEALLAHLRSRLPAFMIPAAVMPLEQLPLTPSGKLDRRALPRPILSVDAETRPYVEPVGPVETALARAWAELLGRERVSADADVFELGANSLLAIRILIRAQQVAATVTLRDVFEAPSPRALAQRMAARTPLLEIVSLDALFDELEGLSDGDAVRLAADDTEVGP